MVSAVPRLRQCLGAMGGVEEDTDDSACLFGAVHGVRYAQSYTIDLSRRQLRRQATEGLSRRSHKAIDSVGTVRDGLERLNETQNRVAKSKYSLQGPRTGPHSDSNLES